MVVFQRNLKGNETAGYKLTNPKGVNCLQKWANILEFSFFDFSVPV